MIRFSCIKTVILVVAVISLAGCKSKQEAPKAEAPKAEAPQQKTEAVKTISGQSATGAMSSSPQDKSDAEAAAVRVLAQMEAGDFSTMYQEAAPTFKKIGSEAAFVSKFQQTRQQVGPFKGQQESSFVTLPDQTFVLVYHMENERFKTDRRLTFARSNSGKMELFGLNQHDEVKGVPAKAKP